MALGRAFIEVHADLRPFKKDLGAGIAALIKQTQAAVDKAVREGMGEAEKAAGGKGRKVISPKIKPELDTSDVDRDSDKMARTMRGRLEQGFKGAISKFNEFWDSSGATRNAIVGALVATAVIAAPLFGAIIAGGVAAAIGAAGIGAGVALALRDTRIKSAVNDLGDFIMGGLERSAASFLAPVAASIGIIRAAFDRFFPRLEAGFAKIAPYVSELAYGFGGFLDKLGPGLEAAFGNAGPFLQIVADYLPVIGEALAYMFTEISNSEGARAGLTAFFQMLGDLIVMVTDGLTWLSEIFKGFIMFVDSLPDFLVPDGIQADVDEMIDSMNLLPAASAGAAGGILSVGDAAGGAAQKARDLTTSLDVFFGKQLEWMDANINFEASIDRVADSFRTNGGAISAATEKGRANLTAVNDSIKAAIRARDAKIKETGSVAAGNAVYQTNIEKLRGVLRSAGLTKGQIDKLIGAYDEIPPEVSTEVSVPGLATALSQAQKLNYELGQIQHDNLSSKRNKGGTNGVGGYATGGIVTQQELAWVGEGNKPEAIIPLTNPGRAAQIMEEAGLLGAGGGTVVVQLVLDGKVIQEQVVQVNQGAARAIQHKPRTLI